MKPNVKKQRRLRRKKHIRKNLSGTNEMPRVYVNRSNKYIYVGVTNDESGEVIAYKRSDKNIESASKLGKDLGAVLVKKKIEKVVFDRSGYKYHGKVKAIADGLRDSGIIL